MKKIHQFIAKDFNGEELYKLAAENNIHIIEENLGNQISGYLHHVFGEKLIHVNSEIPSYCKNFVIAYFLPKNTNTCADDSEIEFLSMKSCTILHSGN